MNPIQKFFDDLWAYLDGKKTSIGSALLIAAVILQEVIIGIFEYDAPWEHKAIKALNWVGMFLGGTGIGHKLMKKKEEAAAPPAPPVQ